MSNSIVSVQWLADHIADPNLIILDASVQNNKSNAIPKHPDLQIAGARYFDFKTVFSDPNHDIPNMMPSEAQFNKGCQELGINQNSHIVIYDNLGIYTSPRAWWMFMSMGHQKVSVLNGGLDTWVAANLPVEPLQTETSYQIGNFKGKRMEGHIVDANTIKTNMVTNQALVIDARSSARFNGTIKEPRPGLKSGHIPQSVNLPYQKVLSEGYLKSETELQAIIKTLPIYNKPLIFTCGSGITACIILLAIQQIKNNSVALYDGSWSEWGTF